MGSADASIASEATLEFANTPWMLYSTTIRQGFAWQLSFTVWGGLGTAEPPPDPAPMQGSQELCLSSYAVILCEVTAPKRKRLGFREYRPTLMHYMNAAMKARDERRLTALHPASSTPDLLVRWEFSTNDTEADTVFSVQQPYLCQLHLLYRIGTLNASALQDCQTLERAKAAQASEALKLRQLIKTPLLMTEHVRTLEPHVDFALAEATDFMRGDVGYDGITGVMKLAHATEGLGLDIEFHGPGPAQRQCIAAVRNTNYYEMGLIHPKAPASHDAHLYSGGYRDTLDAIDRDGCVPVPQGPGLGVEIDWDWVARNRTAMVTYS